MIAITLGVLLAAFDGEAFGVLLGAMLGAFDGAFDGVALTLSALEGALEVVLVGGTVGVYVIVFDGTDDANLLVAFDGETLDCCDGHPVAVALGVLLAALRQVQLHQIPHQTLQVLHQAEVDFTFHLNCQLRNNQ